MTDQLVDAVGLWCVEGLGGVPDVLGGVEHSEGQASQKVPGGQQTCHRPKGEPSRVCYTRRGGKFKMLCNGTTFPGKIVMK